MTDRWRGGRAAALAISIGCGALLTSAVAASDGPRLRVSRVGGAALAQIALPDDGAFALRYRNSLYGTLVEERYVVGADGVVRLTELAAEQLAVLEEYYATTARRGADGWWRAEPAHVPLLAELRLEATDLGERTLAVDGVPPLELWRLVDDAAPSVLLEVEP